MQNKENGPEKKGGSFSRYLSRKKGEEAPVTADPAGQTSAQRHLARLKREREEEEARLEEAVRAAAEAQAQGIPQIKTIKDRLRERDARDLAEGRLTRAQSAKARQEIAELVGRGSGYKFSPTSAEAVPSEAPKPKRVADAALADALERLRKIVNLDAADGSRFPFSKPTTARKLEKEAAEIAKERPGCWSILSWKHELKLLRDANKARRDVPETSTARGKEGKAAKKSERGAKLAHSAYGIRDCKMKNAEGAKKRMAKELCNMKPIVAALKEDVLKPFSSRLAELSKKYALEGGSRTDFDQEAQTVLDFLVSESPNTFGCGDYSSFTSATIDLPEIVALCDAIDAEFYRWSDSVPPAAGTASSLAYLLDGAAQKAAVTTAGALAPAQVPAIADAVRSVLAESKLDFAPKDGKIDLDMILGKLPVLRKLPKTLEAILSGEIKPLRPAAPLLASAPSVPFPLHLVAPRKNHDTVKNRAGGKYRSIDWQRFPKRRIA